MIGSSFKIEWCRLMGWPVRPTHFWQLNFCLCR